MNNTTKDEIKANGKPNLIKLRKKNIKEIKPISILDSKESKESKEKENKKNLGQYFTKHYEYILQDMSIPNNVVNIIEPFAGDGDLLNFVNKNKIQEIKNYIIELYDIDPKHNNIKKQDTIKDPPAYSNKFIITNPPYLARNKSKDKKLFDKYDVNDLYKCFIMELINNSQKPIGGIIIIPLNFWSSIRLNDISLRKAFLEKYDVLQINIFEENVFDDTSYTVCSFQFTLKQTQQPTANSNNINNIKITIYPSNHKMEIQLNDNNNYMIGGEIYKLLSKNNYKISRLTSKNKEKLNTNIIVKCIDDNENSKIGLTFESDNDKLYIDNTPNQSSRTYATLIITPSISLEKQKNLVNKFNKYLNNYRKKYNSLFLTNYRESKDIARKRISFDLVYLIVENILDNFDMY